MARKRGDNPGSTGRKSAGRKSAGEKPTAGDDDAALWARFATTVTPHEKGDRVGPGAPPDPSGAASPPAVGEDNTEHTARPARIIQPGPPPKPPPPRPATPLSHGAAPGVDRRTAARLQRGLMAIDANLDLHGMTQVQAQGSLTRFLLAQHGAGARCVLVVTGKGLNQGGEGSWTPGVLRTAVPEWLNQPPLRDLVLSFSYAQPKHGGSGALYILLRRQKKAPDQ